ncbi:hypothetical protein EH171_22690 [Enterovibrio baiacu]|nr:hypothetical protein [Enterovibrio baiacu]
MASVALFTFRAQPMQRNPKRGSVISDVSDVGVDATTVFESAMSGTFYLACLACDEAGLLFII